MSPHYRRSPLAQGGVEIPCVIIVSMPGTLINQLLMERYKKLVETLYTDQKEEEILGALLQLENTGDQDLVRWYQSRKRNRSVLPRVIRIKKIFQVILQRHHVKQRKNLKPRNRRAQMSKLLIEFWTLVFYLCFFYFFFLKRV